MALLNQAVDEKKFDIRIKDRNVSRGVTTDDQVQKHEKSLSDDSNNAEWVSIEDLRSND